MTDREYEVGESITVPWGLDTVEGKVVGAYGEGQGRRVLVEVNVGDGVTETLPFPQRSLDVARSAEAQNPPGTWVRAARFEEYVRDALTSMMHDTLPRWEGEARANLRIGPHHEIDLLVTLADRVLLVETKYHSSREYARDASTLERLASILMEFQDRRIAPAVGLLVTNIEPSSVLDKQALGYRRNEIPIWVVGWDIERPGTDDNLRRTLEEVVHYRFPLTSSGK